MKKNNKKKNKKWEIQEAFLSSVDTVTEEIGDLFWVFFDARKGFHYAQRQKMGRYENRLKYEAQMRSKKFLCERKDFSTFVSKLKKDGLIKKEKGIISLTQKGKKKLISLKFFRRRMEIVEKSKKELPMNKYILVIFDIPELYKNKRQWIRSVLTDLNYKMVQKSVWMGKNKIPEEFLVSLKELNIIDYVEIFEVSRLGSLND